MSVMALCIQVHGELIAPFSSMLPFCIYNGLESPFIPKVHQIFWIGVYAREKAQHVNIRHGKGSAVPEADLVNSLGCCVKGNLPLIPVVVDLRSSQCVGRLQHHT